MGAKHILDELRLGRAGPHQGDRARRLHALRRSRACSSAKASLTQGRFPPGRTIPALLAELGIPAASAEGYLFPDTYFLPRQDTRPRASCGRWSSPSGSACRYPRIRRPLASELQDRLILASIVEREYKSPEEAPLIASVFYNRLKIKMALQSCATVVYVITERLGKPHPEVIYDRDLKLDDPYNTYEHRGLPPGPISNPGMTSLRAVFYPATSRYPVFPPRRRRRRHASFFDDPRRAH